MTSAYPKTIIERSLSGVNFATGPSALRQNKKASERILAFFTTCQREQPQTNTDGTMESNTKSSFAETHLFENSDNIRLLDQKSNCKAIMRGVNKFLVSKETVVLRRWERSKQKFGFIKRVDKGEITTVKDLES